MNRFDKIVYLRETTFAWLLIIVALTGLSAAEYPTE